MRWLVIVLILVLLAGAIPVTAQDGGGVDQLTVVSVTEHDLMAGPLRTGAYLAPDGERFAHIGGDGITIYTTAGEQLSLITLDESIRRFDNETIRWSPDSRYLVMITDFWRSMRDPDIYVIDTTTGEVRNLTDDGVDKLPFGDSNADWNDVDIDVAPRWVDADRILFVRYTRTGEDYNPPALMTIRPDGSDLTQIGTIEADDPFAITDVDWSADGSQMVYAYAAVDLDARDNGLWLADVDGQNAQWLGKYVYTTEDDRITMPFTKATFSADGQYVLAFNSTIMNMLQMPIDPDTRRLDPQASPLRVFPVEDDRSFVPVDRIIVLNEEYYVRGAGWSPDGHALAYLVTDRLAPDNSGLYISSEPGDPGRLVLPGLFYVPTSYNTQPLTWADNNTIMVSRGGEPGVLVVQLGTE